MSKEFGVGWQDEDAVRMEHFLEVMRLEQERDRKGAKKADNKNKFRKRQ